MIETQTLVVEAQKVQAGGVEIVDCRWVLGGLPAARLGDTCGADAIVKGSATVMIGGLPAARIADLTASGGAIVPPGALTVLIGG